MECVFCNIVKGKIPCVKIYEDNKVLAFLDINPASPGHTLVIPKEHYETIFETPEEVLQEIAVALKRISLALRKTFRCDVKIESFNGPMAEQVIRHLHFHIIPMFKGSGMKVKLGPSWWVPQKYREGEIERVGEEIRKNLI